MMDTFKELRLLKVPKATGGTIGVVTMNFTFQKVTFFPNQNDLALNFSASRYWGVFRTK